MSLYGDHSGWLWLFCGERVLGDRKRGLGGGRAVRNPPVTPRVTRAPIAPLLGKDPAHLPSSRASFPMPCSLNFCLFRNNTRDYAGFPLTQPGVAVTQQEIIPSQVTQKPTTTVPSSSRGSGHLQPLLLITQSSPLQAARLCRERCPSGSERPGQR